MDKLEQYKLQSRMLKVKMKNPIAITMFFNEYPEYKDEKEKIYSIYNLRAVDPFIIEKFEALIK